MTKTYLTQTELQTVTSLLKAGKPWNKIAKTIGLTERTLRIAYASEIETLLSANALTHAPDNSLVFVSAKNTSGPERLKITKRIKKQFPNVTPICTEYQTYVKIIRPSKEDTVIVSAPALRLQADSDMAESITKLKKQIPVPNVHVVPFPLQIQILKPQPDETPLLSIVAHKTTPEDKSQITQILNSLNIPPESVIHTRMNFNIDTQVPYFSLIQIQQNLQSALFKWDRILKQLEKHHKDSHQVLITLSKCHLTKEELSKNTITKPANWLRNFYHKLEPYFEPDWSAWDSPSETDKAYAGTLLNHWPLYIQNPQALSNDILMWNL